MKMSNDKRHATPAKDFHFYMINVLSRKWQGLISHIKGHSRSWQREDGNARKE